MGPIPRRLAVVTNIPAPYRIPLFRRLRERLLPEGFDLHVLFLAREDPRRRWRPDPSTFGFSHTILGHRWDLPLRVALLPFALRDARPDAIVAAGFSPASMLAFAHARRRGIPIGLWSGALPRAGEEQPLRRFLRRKLAKRCSGCLAYGSASRDYLLGLGVPPQRVFRAWNTVDVDRFAAEPPTRPPAPPVRLLVSGNLEAKKRPDLAVRAAAAARALGGDIRLTFAGEGPERAATARLARRLEVPAEFTGHRAPEEMPAIYAAHHALAFPSEADVWGLVLVEAMAAGLCCYASVRAGATRDVVEEGKTGFALDFRDAGEVARALLAPPERIASMGREGQVRARSEFSLDRSCDAWVDMVRTWTGSA